MAEFTGTIQEFTTFIGGYSRNKVQSITRKYRKDKKKCEECSSKTKHLHAAHIRGKERPKIIADILSNHIANDIVHVDLMEFEEKFIAAHTPIHETIRILCHSCHVKYDRLEAGSDVIYEQEEANEEVAAKQEADATEEHIKLSMSKTSAIQFVASKINQPLSNSNVVFANSNKTVSVWWLEPGIEKFKEDLYLILNDSLRNTLNVFKIPSKTIDPADHFDLRKGKTLRAKIIVPISSTSFEDQRSFSFDPFLITQLSY